MTEFVFVLLALLMAFLAVQLIRLRGKVESLSDRLSEMERREGRAAPAVSPNEMPPRKEPPPPIPAVPKRVPGIVSEPPSPTPLPARPPIDWEQFMGVKMFAWLGGLALFLGVVFLVKYSFENSLITPFGRILIGMGVGLGLLATGWWLAHGRYRATAQSLCATGIVILYANIFAAHSFYQLVSLTTAFFAMSAITLGSFLLAVNLSAQVVVILGLLGGFLTPVLLPSGADNARVLFLYIGLLDLGVAAVALRKRWLYLVLLAALGTVFTQLGWAIQFFNARKGVEAFGIFLWFEALFLALYFFSERRRPPGRWMAAAASLAGLSALGFGFWLSAFPALARPALFFFSFVFLADAGLLALSVIGRAHCGTALGVGALLKLYRAEPARGDARLAWQGGALLLFVSLIFPLQFEREWITLGWALEGLALLALFHRVPHRGLRVVAVLLLAAAFARLALNPAVLEYHKRNGARIWNWYLYAYGIAIACLLTGAAIFGRPREDPLERSGPPFLGSLGALLAFLLLNIEIADYFSIGPTLTFPFREILRAT